MNQVKTIEFISDFALIDVITTKFAIYDNAAKNGYGLSDINYNTQFGFDVNFLYNIQDELLKVETIIQLELRDEHAKAIGISADFTFDTVFEVKNFSDRFPSFPKGNDINTEELALLVKLCNLSFGTIRGLLIEKTNNTALAGFILPFITDESFAKIIQDK